MQKTIFIILVSLVASCKNNPVTTINNNNKVDSTEIVAISVLDTLNSTTNGSDVINPQIWKEASQYGETLCNCGKEVFEIQERRIPLSYRDMNDKERESLETKFNAELEPVKELYYLCRAEALRKFEEISNPEQNLITPKQADSLKLLVMNGFDRAGCDKYKLVRANIFSD